VKLYVCPLTGRTFDMEAVQANPYRLVPGTTHPADTEAVEGTLPKLSPTHPQHEQREIERKQAFADLPVPFAP